MKHKSRICIFIGMILLIASMGLALYNFLMERTAAQASAYTSRQIVTFQDEQGQERIQQSIEMMNPDLGSGDDVTPASKDEIIPDYILNPKMDMPVVELDGHDYIALLEIPALSLTLPIMDQWSYDGLKIAPGRFSGSLYTNDLVIAGHNYTSHFGSIKDLLTGENLFITDMDGNVFAYEVLGTEILQSNDVDNMIHGEWDLTLFTCTVGGLQRVSVRCQLSAEEFR